MTERLKSLIEQIEAIDWSVTPLVEVYGRDGPMVMDESQLSSYVNAMVTIEVITPCQ